MGAKSVPEKIKTINKSIIFNIKGNKKEAEKIVDNIPQEKQTQFFNDLSATLLPNLIKSTPAINTSSDAIISKIDLPKIINNKNPEHIIRKRIVDYNEYFIKDLIKIFKRFSTRSDYPLHLTSIQKVQTPIEKGDLGGSYYDDYNIELEDDLKRIHQCKITIPRMLDDGTFQINGRKRFLLYQIILDPIYFIKKNIAKFETGYAPFTIELKETKTKNYFQCYIAGCKYMPISVLIFYAFGFEETCKLFNITYSFEDLVPSKDKKFIQLNDGKYIVFNFNNLSAEYMINSLFNVNIDISSTTIFNKKSWENCIIESVTHNRNSIFTINEVINNIVDDKSIEVLKSKLLPYELDKIIKYMCDELVKGRVDERADLTKQRLRSTEVFISQIQKLVYGAYNEYRSRRVSGDDDAKFQLDVTHAVSEIVNSKLVRLMENINPLEELSCLTRINPTGEGGIPEADSVTAEQRGIHSSYMGNIDAFDTPENANVGVTNQLSIDAYITNNTGSFLINPSSVDDSGSFGVNSCIVPYPGATDGCRLMFSGSQGRQCVPINGSEPPMTQTGYESILVNSLSDSYIKKSPVNGIIKQISETTIFIEGQDKQLYTVSIQPKMLYSGQGLSSINYFTPTIKIGSKVKQNEIIAEGHHIKDGTLSMGTNLCIAIMQWKGYSYDDGYIISDAIAKDKLTSYSYYSDDYEILIKKDDSIKFIIEEGVETNQGQPLLIRTSRDIETLVGIEDEDENIEGKIIKKSPGGKVLSVEIYPNISLKNFPILQEQFNKFKKRYEELNGAMPKKFKYLEGSTKVVFDGILIKFKIEKQMPAEIGDKITNSFGGKGCIARIEKQKNMPVTPWGQPVDIILNPLAIINRMNPSTTKEMYTSLISKFLSNIFLKYGRKKNPQAIKTILDVYNELDNTKGKIIYKGISSAFTSMNEKQYVEYYDKINKYNYMPVIVPQFHEPTMDQLDKVLKMVGAKKKYKLYLPEFKTYTGNEIAIGYLYYKKLEQQSSIKMSSRSVGMVNSLTRQAVKTKGASAQRLGEMDSWALISHNATNVLREFFGPLSDDHEVKTEIVSNVINTGESNYKQPKSTPTLNLMRTYMTGMMIESEELQKDKKK